MTGIPLRCELRPGDVGEIVRWHGVTYARERGYNSEFEGGVAARLGEFAMRRSPRERIWLAEADGRLVGCVAIVSLAEAGGEPGASGGIAQLRWFLVDPAARGRGLGARLLDEAVAFAREQGHERVILFTVSELVVAARLYRRAGFELVEERPARRWGVDVVEQRYERVL